MLYVNQLEYPHVHYAHKVRVNAPFIYCSYEVLAEESIGKRDLPLYMFKRK